MSEKKYHEVSSSELRKELKRTVFEQIKKLPDYFNELGNKEWYEVILKLFPFVFPKANKIGYQQGESTELEIKTNNHG